MGEWDWDSDGDRIVHTWTVFSSFLFPFSFFFFHLNFSKKKKLLFRFTLRPGVVVAAVPSASPVLLLLVIHGACYYKKIKK